MGRVPFYIATINGNMELQISSRFTKTILFAFSWFWEKSKNHFVVNTQRKCKHNK